MRRLVGIIALLAALTSPLWAEAKQKPRPQGSSSSIEIDGVRGSRELDVLKVDAAGNIVDPDCRLMADEIAQHVAQNRVSAPVGKSAIAHHTEACNKLRETQYKQMEENQRRISADRERETEEKLKSKETAQSACVEKCRSTCAANCPPATITGGTAASGLITADSPCPVACPPKDVCEKRCAK